MNIVLYQPEIPQNTGSIGRTCMAAGASLHLIHPLGFRLSEKNLRRAGMDYWESLKIYEYDNFSNFLDKNPSADLFFAETNENALIYTQAKFSIDDFIVFGSESQGIPKDILEKYPNRVIKIPMKNNSRSLNLAASVAIILYEAIRQNS